ncbi:MAG: hypothetical protein GAK43_02204 [Stenotrophomonas maltophilia]|nr:MAG: hypothetical protein GAK43_02204 [Stenotrophomonas maltophilia]
MPRVIVGIWNCVAAPDWFDSSMDVRLGRLYAAIQAVDVEGRLRGDTGLHGVHAILVAPEYAFSDPHAPADQTKPAIQTTAARLGDLRTKLIDATTSNRSTLVVAGTIAHVDAQQDARNTSLVAHAGVIVSQHDKCVPVGEVQADDGMTFQPGTGFGRFSLDHLWYGVEICADATGVGHLGIAVDVHIVVGQGVGVQTIVNQATRYLIVADIAAYGVYDATAALQKQKAYKRETLLTCPIEYYRITL